MIIDNVEHLLQRSSELPGLIQQLSDEHQRGEGIGARIILCGSAMSVVHELLPGTKPLRGRAVIDLRLGGFGYRTSRDFWEIEDPFTALHVHAVVGGAPGYRLITGRTSPNDSFDTWVTETLLNPGRAIYSRTETEYLLREDPRITQHTLYYDIRGAVALASPSGAMRAQSENQARTTAFGTDLRLHRVRSRLAQRQELRPRDAGAGRSQPGWC